MVIKYVLTNWKIKVLARDLQLYIWLVIIHE